MTTGAAPQSSPDRARPAKHHTHHMPLAALVTVTTFAAAYGMAPLYYSNQNQYFLHGMARAHVGDLAHDWLASTRDPTPVFSGIVTITEMFGHSIWFYAYQAMLLALYARAILGIFFSLAGPDLGRQRWPIFAMLCVLAHSAALRLCTYQLVGEDIAWFLQAGVAGQYVLGAMFQPSVFGIFLVAAVGLFLQERIQWAVLGLAIAGTVHATYLLPATMLLLGFVSALALDRRWIAAIAVIILGGLLFSPPAYFALSNFGPTTAQTFSVGQDILVNIRIPHHCRVDRWLDGVAIAQIGFILIALPLCRNTRLFTVMTVAFTAGAILTLVQVATQSNAMALLFPWRISAVLMPLAVTVILTRLVQCRPAHLFGLLPRLACVAILLALGGAGTWLSLANVGFRSADEEIPAMQFVAQNLQSGEQYLLPVPDLANLSANRGSLSSDFIPPRVKMTDTRVVPVGFQRFRLFTGAPVYVDFKSIPYKDVDVIEWRDRMVFAKKLWDALRGGQEAMALEQLRKCGVTHVVLPGGDALTGRGLQEVFRDEYCRIYALTGP
jgi:hypothetical protein